MLKVISGQKKIAAAAAAAAAEAMPVIENCIDHPKFRSLRHLMAKPSLKDHKWPNLMGLQRLG